MRIGLVGKPNVGKSTTFAALTETTVEIANYPFTTIEPNVGVTWISSPTTCPCSELRAVREADGRIEPASDDDERGGSICQPNTGSCNGFTRLVPVTLVDVAGLVPGAHEGRGRGNQFLSDLAACDALIQVVDASGATDLEGNPTGPGASDPLAEHEFLVDELAAWIEGILAGSWNKGTRRTQSEGDRAMAEWLHEQLSGIGADEIQVTQALAAFHQRNRDVGNPWQWSAELKRELADELRKAVFPLFVAANKADLAEPALWEALEARVAEENGLLMATTAESELALRRAAKAGLIAYVPGEPEFELTAAGEEGLTAPQRQGLDELADRLSRLGGSGIVPLLSAVVYDRLEQIVAHPVQDETHWTDGDGRVLPDALLVKRGTTARGLAYAVHTDLGDGFIRATDARTSRIIGAEHELEDGAVVKIHAKT